jgi:hypothetical protein
MDRIHSADLEPAGDRVSHTLIINGLPAARFDELKKAIAARQLTIEQSLEQRPRCRMEPGAEEGV